MAWVRLLPIVRWQFLFRIVVAVVRWNSMRWLRCYVARLLASLCCVLSHVWWVALGISG